VRADQGQDRAEQGRAAQGGGAIRAGRMLEGVEGSETRLVGSARRGRGVRFAVQVGLGRVRVG
jgi:hypothetical protein